MKSLGLVKENLGFIKEIYDLLWKLGLIKEMWVLLRKNLGLFKDNLGV